MALITMDWLAFTFKEESDNARKWISTYSGDNQNAPAKPTNGYNRAVTSEMGVLHMWHTDRQEMGHHFVLAGSVIRKLLSGLDVDQRTLIQSVVNAGASITRLDIAKDFQGEEISLDKIYSLLERREYVGSAQNVRQIHSNNGGNTIYIGSPTSDKMVRLYDKAAEQKLPHELWTRLELQAKGMAARALATYLCQNDSDWNSAMSSIIRNMADVQGSSAYQFMLQCDAEIGLPQIEKKSDREAWIAKQVVPTVARHFSENRDSAAVRLLIDILKLIESDRDYNEKLFPDNDGVE